MAGAQPCTERFVALDSSGEVSLARAGADELNARSNLWHAVVPVILMLYRDVAIKSLFTEFIEAGTHINHAFTRYDYSGVACGGFVFEVHGDDAAAEDA